MTLTCVVLMLLSLIVGAALGAGLMAVGLTRAIEDDTSPDHRDPTA